jgi:hypothetical protein
VSTNIIGLAQEQVVYRTEEKHSALGVDYFPSWFANQVLLVQADTPHR